MPDTPADDNPRDDRPAADTTGEASLGGAERPPLDIPEPGLPTAKVDVLYRVFCARPQMPSLDDLLTRLISKNPYNPTGGFVFAPPNGIRRLQDALGASQSYFVMGYLREEAPGLWEEAQAALPTQGQHLDEPEVTTVTKSPLCVVIRAQIENPENNEFIETLQHLADAFRDLCHGVVWDVYMGQLWTERDWTNAMQAPLSPLSHVQVHQHATSDAAGAPLWLTTSGLRKFGSAELEIHEVPREDAFDVEAFLMDGCEHLIQGDLLEPDDTFTYRTTEVRVVAGPSVKNADGSVAYDVLRIVDAPDDPEATLKPSDGTEGAPRLVASIRTARLEVEGQRARSGRAAM